MSNSIKKIVTGISTVALAVSMLVVPVAKVDAATAGEVYKTTDGTVWFITKDMKKRPFTSAGAFMSYGFLSFSQVKEADSSVTSLPTGDFIAPQDGRIFCATETKGSDVSGECALITGSKKAAFTSSSVFSGQGFSFSRAYYGDSSFLSKTSNVDNASAQHLPGTLINNNGTVQLVVSGGLWGVPSMDVFNSWGWSFADVVPANSADVLLSQTGVIPARMAGELVPSGVSTGNPGTPGANCNDLDGSTGSIDVSAVSDYNNEKVGEGEDEVPVMAFEIEADNDSDIAVTSVKVEFDENGTGSEDFEDYANEVQIWLGDEQVGSADAEDFTESATNGTWTKTISLDCAAVAADETELFTVSVSGNSTIDSADLNQAWIADVLSVRFEDGDGVTTTEETDTDTLEKTFTFQSFASATDVELKASLTEGDDAEEINDAHIIDIDDTDDTEDVEILAFTLENKGESDITINDLPVAITTAEAAGTNFDDPAEVITKVTLWSDGDQIASDSLTETDANDTEVALFEDLDIQIDADDTMDFTVAVSLQDTASVLDNGDTVQATLNVSTIDADDEEGDQLAGGDLTGTAVGLASAVYDAGIMTSFVDADATRTLIADAAGEFDQGTFNITFEVTAFDGDFRIDKSCEEGGGDAAGQGVEYTITNSGSNSTTCVVTSASTDTEDTANVFEVDEDTTREFTLTVNATSSADAFAEVALESINWGTATNDTNANYYNFDLGDYKTNAIFLNTF